MHDTLRNTSPETPTQEAGPGNGAGFSCLGWETVPRELALSTVMFVPLPGGLSAIIDSCDYRLVAPYRWRVKAENGIRFYARTSPKIGGKVRHILMHRLIAQASEHEVIDHKNGHGLINQRSNLRLCCRGENCRNTNKPKTKNPSSKYKGVYFCNTSARWIAHIRYQRLHYSLGRYGNEKDAAIAYNKAAVEMFGEYARLNRI